MDVSRNTLYLLDTNTVGCAVNGRSKAVRAKLAEVMEHSTVAISTLTEAEMLYGLALKPTATRLRAGVEAFLSAVLVLPWDSAAARVYAKLRASMTATGKSLAAMDMLIAAHAVSAGATLVTRDKAFSQIDALHGVVNWAVDI